MGDPDGPTLGEVIDGGASGHEVDRLQAELTALRAERDRLRAACERVASSLEWTNEGLRRHRPGVDLGLPYLGSLVKELRAALAAGAGERRAEP